MDRWTIGALIASTALALIGCGGKPEPPKTPMRPEPSAERMKAAIPVVDASNEFGLKILDLVANETEKANVLVSPVSLQICSALLLESAVGPERDEMKKALGLGAISDKDMGVLIQTLTDALLSDPERPLQLANAVWLNGAFFKVEKPFADRIAKLYGGEIGSSKGPDETKTAINAWVNKNTNGMIPELLDFVDLHEHVLMLNAVAFEARWQHEFEESKTTPSPFKTLSGGEVRVPLMSGSFMASEAQEEEYAGVRMDYIGGSFSMAALLPPEGKTPLDVLKVIQDRGFDEVLNTFHKSKVQVWFPKFSWRDDHHLNKAFRALGVVKAFVHLDQTPLSPELAEVMFLSRVLQRTFIEVDENGTRAAAATAEAVAAGGPSPLVFDRPFLYAIVHNKTGAILFLGICGDPSLLE